MAITIDWVNGIINVPRADMTLVQSTPIEIRELNLNAFRLELRDLEEDPDGRPWPRTHDHNTEFTTGGITFARVVEILEPYTITFENGTYLVNIIGGNSNIADRVNPNNVSIRANNSAGLITSKDTEYASFNGGVSIDVIDGVSGTVFPTGTERQPVNNVADAILIANFRGFYKLKIIGNLNLVNGDNVSEFILEGQTWSKTTINIDSLANVSGCEFINSHVTGTLDGNSTMHHCLIDNINYIEGHIHDCMINPGTISLGGGGIAHFKDCYSGEPGSGSPTIDFGGSGQGLGLREYNGGILLINKNGTESVSIDLASGQVKLDLTTVTNGEIVVRGDGKVIDASDGSLLESGTYSGLILINETTPSKEEISDSVWNHIKALTFGKWFSLKKK